MWIILPIICQLFWKTIDTEDINLWNAAREQQCDEQRERQDHHQRRAWWSTLVGGVAAGRVVGRRRWRGGRRWSGMRVALDEVVGAVAGVVVGH